MIPIKTRLPGGVSQLNHGLTTKDLTAISDRGEVFRGRKPGLWCCGPNEVSRLVISLATPGCFHHAAWVAVSQRRYQIGRAVRFAGADDEIRVEETKTAKGEQTRALILKSALELLEQRGYEKTTMRAIADKAGVSLGNAYHYFGSKEHLIQAFYHRLHEEHVAATGLALKEETSFKARLLAVMKLKISTLEPYHEFAGVLFKTAADPHSPLNPFADKSAPVRRDSIELFEELVVNTKARIPEELRAQLPYLLWLYHMGVILFWIHDDSPKRARSHRLVEQTVDLLDKLISLASNPLMRPVRKRALKMVAELRELNLETA
jgi:AcrR family transcriptional regulator